MIGFSETEYDQLYHAPVGQRRKLRPGITRAQAHTMFRRRDATTKAAAASYHWGGMAHSAQLPMTEKEIIDKLLRAGFTTLKQRGRRMYLTRGPRDDKWQFSSKTACNYIRVALGLVTFKKNY